MDNDVRFGIALHSEIILAWNASRGHSCSHSDYLQIEYNLRATHNSITLKIHSLFYRVRRQASPDLLSIA